MKKSEKMLIWGAVGLGALLFVVRRASASPVRRERKRPGEVFVPSDDDTKGMVFDCRQGGAATACLDLTDESSGGYVVLDPSECAELVMQRPDESECRFLTSIWSPAA